MSAIARFAPLTASSLASKRADGRQPIGRVSARRAAPARVATVASIRQQQGTTTGTHTRYPFTAPRNARAREISATACHPSRASGSPSRRADRPPVLAQPAHDAFRTDPSVRSPVTRQPVESRDSIRMGIPSKGRMAEDTMDLLADCQLKVRKINPRQYAAEIPNVPGMEVWFQRATDVVRKLISGDVDIGIVGYDMLREIGNEDPDLVVVHDALGFGGCHLAVAVPQAWEDVNSLRDLMADKRFSAERPLRVVTAYMNLADQFFKEQGFEHVELSTADGALEAAPAMGAADCILDLVSSGTTLRENNLKQIDGGRVLESQGCLVASRTALLERPGTLEIIHEMLERLEAHLRADGLFMVTANVRGASAEEVATKLATSGGQLLKGLQGPTVSPIYTPSADGSPSKEGSFYAVSLAVPKTRIYETVKELRKNGGSGVLTFPLTYVFDEEPPRWSALINNLGLDAKDYEHLKIE